METGNKDLLISKMRTESTIVSRRILAQVGKISVVDISFHAKRISIPINNIL